VTITLQQVPARLRALPAAVPLLPALTGAEEVRVVGGAVRDLLLGGAPLDLDLVTDGDAAAVAERIAAALGDGAQIEGHERFGTITVRGGGHAYDLVRARAERYDRPGALPEVRPGSFAEDLARRDFTVNAIATTLEGRLDAVPGALDDLAAGRMRILHERSFEDDPTRLLRLVRYATRLGFATEPRTAELARAAIDGGALATVSGPRVGAELRRTLREPTAPAALAEIATWSGGDALVPRLSFDAALARRAVGLLAPDGRRDLLLLAVAALRVGDALAGWLAALDFPARERDVVAAAAGRASHVGERLAAAAGGGAAGGSAGGAGTGRASEIVAALHGASPELAALAGALGGEGAGAAVACWRAELRAVRLEIDGADLRAAGVPQGAALGRGLAAALRAKLDGEAVGREAELAAALAGARET
jgi:tRNA nucleotidyltransferase (CCA-adding enzyme)